MKKYRVGVIGLHMGLPWAKAAASHPLSKLTLVYDKFYDQNETLDKTFFESSGCKIVREEDEIYQAGLDVVIVASPDHFHVEQSIKALGAGSHVICEKPLAPTVAECRKIISAAQETGKMFMTGQVCRYAPGFVLAKKLVEAGRVGDIAFIESEYAHDYAKAPGFNNWRKDPAIRREGFLGGGCHAMDLLRWFAGNPIEVTAYMNRKLLASDNWPTDDTGIAICKFPDNVIGKVFVSIGSKRPYTMRTAIYGTAGTIICDNTGSAIQIFEEALIQQTGNQFSSIPVSVNNHNVAAELNEFLYCLRENRPVPTDVYEGTRTVAFGEAALESARTGRPIPVQDIR
jgi:predicted dehydrogenase